MRSVSAVIVTRGDVDLSPILGSLPFDDIVVWDNSQREDLGLYGGGRVTKRRSNRGS